MFVSLCVVCITGCKDEPMGLVLKKLFETPYFRITVVPDAETVELCGALKVCLCVYISQCLFLCFP